MSWRTALQHAVAGPRGLSRQVCVVLLALSGWAAEAETPCPIIPLPKVYHDLGREGRLLGADKAAIMIGAKASEPERYAAEQLQTLIARRFGLRLPIRVEGSAGANLKQIILLGQRTSSVKLDKICREKQLDLGPAAPGLDGFIVEMVEEGGLQTILVGGSDPRGVVYGQEAFFELLRGGEGAVTFPIVSVRDWPSIAWRGRPHSVLLEHLEPGAMDAYAMARINFIDVRDDPRVRAVKDSPARKASMGCPAGADLDQDTVRRVVTEAHRRGIYVYGTVAAAVEGGRCDAVVQTFDNLIALGVDGLWISFDDLGERKGAATVVARVLDLGRRHGMTGRDIAFTPPLGSYEVLDTTCNRALAAIPGLAQAQWFFTRVPCPQDRDTARRIGLERLPAWWHNLVSFPPGFLYIGEVAWTLRADDKPAYVDLQPLSGGWGAPTYARLHDAGDCTDAVMLWGLVGGWPEEYELGALGLWAWNPAGHDWPRTRRAIYSRVFGPAQAATAQAFDEKLSELKPFFQLPDRPLSPDKGWPCRLLSPAYRDEALRRIGALDLLLIQLQSAGSSGSALDPARLAKVYLEPMQATLAYARTMTELDYPDYLLADMEADLCTLLAAGREDDARHRLAELRAEVLDQLARIEKALHGLKGIEEYAALWRDRMTGLAYWNARRTEREVVMPARFRSTMATDPALLFPYAKPPRGELSGLLDPLRGPPPGALLAEVAATNWLNTPVRWRGSWSAGPYADDRHAPVSALAYPRNAPSVPGDAAEVRMDVGLPVFKGRLRLDVFVNDSRLDNAWRNYRFMQLWVNDTLTWEEDIAPTRAGREWVSVDVTDQAKARAPLHLRFRVIDKQAVSTYATVIFLGPVRLRVAGQE